MYTNVFILEIDFNRMYFLYNVFIIKIIDFLIIITL